MYIEIALIMFSGAYSIIILILVYWLRRSKKEIKDLKTEVRRLDILHSEVEAGTKIIEDKFFRRKTEVKNNNSNQTINPETNGQTIRRLRLNETSKKTQTSEN